MTTFRKTLSLITLACVLATVQGTSSTFAKFATRRFGVSNGVDAAADQFPHIAYLKVTKSDGTSFRCAGFLFAANLVVTAGYCVYNIAGIEVTVGETNIGASTSSTYSKTRYTVEAKMWRPYDTFNGDQIEDDIGIVYLPVNIQRNDNTAIGYLYLNDPKDSGIYTTYYYNKIADVAGWGSTDGTTSYSNTLKTTSVKIIDIATCQTQLHATFTKTVVCLASPNTSPSQGACPGDYGAPVSINGFVLSVVGYADPAVSCLTTYPHATTPIYPYYNWIVQKLKDANDGKPWTAT